MFKVKFGLFSTHAFPYVKPRKVRKVADFVASYLGNRCELRQNRAITHVNTKENQKFDPGPPPPIPLKHHFIPSICPISCRVFLIAILYHKVLRKTINLYKYPAREVGVGGLSVNYFWFNYNLAQIFCHKEIRDYYWIDKLCPLPSYDVEVGDFPPPPQPNF